MAGKNAIGLDIGSSSIKIIQLREDRKGVHLQAFDMAMLPPEAVVDGALMNFTAIVEKIKELVAANRIRQRDVCVSVSGHSVIIKKISLPEMTSEELDESIQWEAEQYIPFDIKDVNVDVQIVNPKAGQGQMDVLLVAAKKDVIHDYVSVVAEAGLRTVCVDVDTFALQNMFELGYGFPPNETIALVNVGAAVININVIANGMTTFTRDISMGGGLLTAEIQKHLNVSYEEAEHYKTAGEGNITNSTIAREVQVLSEKVSQTLVTEIQRSLDFYAATTVNTDISRLYLSGGSAQIPPLIRLLERNLEVPVELVNPFKNIIIDPRKFDVDALQRMAPVAAVAVGQGLRKAGDNT
ncbi:MAG: type IV pilus assembly protein PilM [Deltaproteobacteria bacterium]|nr:type IV pilus assembly protein PilM [Deltaproteobacteria bacterium]MCB9788447.1 type IV pilus assembly protein PilM [Deltaproteobacteria bacterium]